MSPRRTRPAPRGTDRRTALLLAAACGVSGVLHLARPAVYDAVVPRSMPGPARFWTTSSGLAEVVVAGALASTATRRAGGLLAAALFVAVFPANVSMALRALGSGRAGTARRVVTAARLPLQVPLVAAALRVGRAS
ncbi:DoxX family protein [Frigoribacterium faeni]|uniref:DoxX family protein n=1 Tax=Frigoribacterium faeni TaxID=145483 RepID=UPI00141B5C96|nr:hypothetical protein [Frigoribacterium faeni]NIJ04896.1 putative membrane protein [Frigoribacterium faeni]